ncbi:MAG: hypothetical protein ACKOET_12800, partial [Verrucomicrobiota bacterium]
PSGYEVTQDLRHAEIRTRHLLGGAPVRTRSYLAPMDNLWVLELAAAGGRGVPVRATLSVVGNAYVARGAGTTGPVAWVTKEPHAEGAPFYVKGAVAARVLGADATPGSDGRAQAWLTFVLPADGTPVWLVVPAEHLKNAGSPLAGVRTAARSLDAAGVREVEERNRAWWKAFWLRSFIRLADPVQRYWYNHLYLVGSCARSGRAGEPGHAPGHWGHGTGPTT